MLDWFQNLIDKYPKTSYIVIGKILWIVGFFYSVWVIQGYVPDTRQWILGSVYALATLPLGYWLTYCFGGHSRAKKESITEDSRPEKSSYNMKVKVENKGRGKPVHYEDKNE